MSPSNNSVVDLYSQLDRDVSECLMYSNLFESFNLPSSYPPDFVDWITYTYDEKCVRNPKSLGAISVEPCLWKRTHKTIRKILSQYLQESYVGSIFLQIIDIFQAQHNKQLVYKSLAIDTVDLPALDIRMDYVKRESVFIGPIILGVTFDETPAAPEVSSPLLIRWAARESALAKVDETALELMPVCTVVCEMPRSTDGEMLCDHTKVQVRRFDVTERFPGGKEGMFRKIVTQVPKLGNVSTASLEQRIALSILHYVRTCEELCQYSKEIDLKVRSVVSGASIDHEIDQLVIAAFPCTVTAPCATALTFPLAVRSIDVRDFRYLYAISRSICHPFWSMHERISDMIESKKKGYESAYHDIPKEIGGATYALGAFAVEYRRLLENHPELENEAPVFGMPDGLAVASMFSSALASSRLYELPRDISGRLSQQWTNEYFEEFLERLVWPVLWDEVCAATESGTDNEKQIVAWRTRHPKVVRSSDELKERVRIVFKLQEPVSARLKNAIGLYPLLLLVLRRAFWQAIVERVNTEDNMSGRVEIALSPRNLQHNRERVTVFTSGSSSGFRDRLSSWNAHISRFEKLCEGWIVDKHSRDTESNSDDCCVYDDEMKLYRLSISRRES